MGHFARVLLAAALAAFAVAQPLEAARELGAPAPLMKLNPALAGALQGAAPGERLRVIVRFSGSASLSRATAGLGAASRPARGLAVAGALQASAAAAQSGPKLALARAQAEGRAARARWFWISNAVALEADAGVIAELAARPDVRSVALDEARKWLVEPDAAALEAGPAARAQAAQANVAPPGDGGATWGVAKIGADRVRRGLGVDGSGVVVANIDSGVDWTHPALATRYRGYGNGVTPDHLRNWYDATDGGAAVPVDGNGHGTHTMGTMVGGEGIGVAPGARWMAARGLNSAGVGYDSWLIAAMEFMLAPGGDPASAPDIVNNSWGSTDSASLTFSDEIAALQAAGILVIFSAGNSGPSPASLGSPGSNPGVPAIGASDADDGIAWFSSRGPSPWGEIKPWVSAPGVDVVSSVPGGVYRKSNGTSMAAPHVAGAAALLMSAMPTLSGPAALNVLTRTAVPLSTTIPNNDSGWGRINVYSAALSIVETGMLSGTVSVGVAPVAGVSVTARSAAVEVAAVSDAAGRYALSAPAGTYTLTAEAYGYVPTQIGPRVVVTHESVVVDVAMTALPSGTARGSVIDATTGASITVTVSAIGTPRSGLSNVGCAPCGYALELPTGVYTLEARGLGYGVQTRTVTISDGGLSTADFALTPTVRLALVDSGAFYYGSAIIPYRQALNSLGLAWDEIVIKQVPRDTPPLTQLLAYDAVIWSSPLDSPGIVGAGQTLSSYLSAGRALLLSGQDVGYYDGGPFSVSPYFSRLKVDYVGDSAQTTSVVGEPGGAWAGRVFTIAGGDGAGNQVAPDQIAIADGDSARALARYANPALPRYDVAGVLTGQCLDYRVAYFPFGLEAISTATDRAQAIGGALAELTAPRPTLGAALATLDTLPTGDVVGRPGATVTRTFRLRNTGEAGIAQTFSLTVSGNLWPASLSADSVTLAPCQTALVVLSTTIPGGVVGRAFDTATVTAAVLAAPTATASLDLVARTPAGTLFVDDDRWYDMESAYENALRSAGIDYDRWDTNWVQPVTAQTPVPRPSLEVLSRYASVIWYTGYDWADPITPGEEAALSSYLDGGGRLFFTSQSALAYTGIDTFSQRYLGVAGIQMNDTITATLAEPGNPVTGRAVSGGSLLPFPAGYSWNTSATLTPMSDTRVIARGLSGQPAALAREGPAGGGARWRTVFMPYAFEAYTATVRGAMLEQIAAWLSPLGDSVLEADRDAVDPGGKATFTLTLQADSVFPPASSFASTARVSVTLDGLTVLTSALSEAGGAYAGERAITLEPGGRYTLPFSAQADGMALPGTPLTATAHIAIPELGLRFTRILPLRAGASTLFVTLSVSPETPRPREKVRWTMRVTNTSAVVATAAMTTAAPDGLRLLTPTLVLDGPGAAAVGAGLADQARVVWRGVLAPGATATVAFDTQADWRIRTLDGALVPWRAAVRADETLGGWWGDGLWLWPAPALGYLPIVRAP